MRDVDRRERQVGVVREAAAQVPEVAAERDPALAGDDFNFDFLAVRKTDEVAREGRQRDWDQFLDVLAQGKRELDVAPGGAQRSNSAAWP
jgi:hypothetical protein